MKNIKILLLSKPPLKKEVFKDFLLFSIIMLIIPLLGCQKPAPNRVFSNEQAIAIEMSESTVDISTEKTQKWHIENGKIIVLFGYGFNNEDFTKEAKSLLDENFGLDENGGTIMPIVFPDDFKHKEKSVNSDFFSIINDNDIDLKGIILLGAPENTYRALSRIQDLWDGIIPYPVFALFPQDDLLGIEDTCDIVLDRLQKAELDTSLMEESEQQNVQDVEDILLKTVNYMICTETGPAKDSRISVHAQQMLPNKKVMRYMDSETGLYSLNHFVIE